MNEFLLYQLKVAACLAVFYLFFKWTLSRETFHCFNRILLLAGTVAAFLLPVWVVTRVAELPAVSDLPLTPEAGVAATAAVSAEADGSRFADVAVQSLFLIGILGGSLAFLRLSWSLACVVRTIRGGRRERLDGRGVLVRVTRPVIPFSWMRYIVIGERDLSADSREILLHEQAHVRLGHSWDLLCMDLLCCVQWFNPAIWLLRRELGAIHEYEADAAVLAAGADPRRYQLLLIRKSVGEKNFVAANSFNHDKLKNRVNMMLREKSSRGACVKALLLLPLLGIALSAFSETVYRESEPLRGKMQTVVVRGDSLTVRGGQAKPLIIVDGLEAASLDEVGAADIESVTVLKDSAALRLYGRRAKDGVVIVTRKNAARTGKARTIVVNVPSESGDPSDGTVSERYEVVNLSSESGDSSGGTASERYDIVIRRAGETTVSDTVAGQRADKKSRRMRTVVSVTGNGGREVADASSVTRIEVTDHDASGGSREALEQSRAASQDGLAAARAARDQAREALVESGTSSGAELDAARKALEQARADLARNRQASQEALQATREKMNESRRALDKALKGSGSDATVMLGGPDGSVKIGGTIEADGRLILIDGKRATQREMNRTLRKKVRQINIVRGEEAVPKYGDEACDGAIEIITIE